MIYGDINNINTQLFLGLNCPLTGRRPATKGGNISFHFLASIIYSIYIDFSVTAIAVMSAFGQFWSEAAANFYPGYGKMMHPGCFQSAHRLDHVTITHKTTLFNIHHCPSMLTGHLSEHKTI